MGESNGVLTERIALFIVMVVTVFSFGFQVAIFLLNRERNDILMANNACVCGG